MADIKTKTTVLSVDVNDAVRRTGEYKTKIDELRRSLQGLKEDSEEYNRVARELNETIAGLNASLNASSSGNMDKLGRSLQNVSAQVNDTTKTIQNSNLAGRIAELRQQMNEAGEFSSVKEYKEYLDLLKASLLNLDEGSEEYAATANELRDAQDRLNRVMQASKGYADAAEGSYNYLVRTMSDLKRQWRATADEEERAQIGKKILDINNQLKEMDASIGNYQRNVGDYQNAFEEAFKVVLRGIGANSSALGHLSSQIIQMIPMIKKTIQVATTGMKGIKAALASTGIGLLVVALGEVVAHWNDIVGLVTGATARQKEYTRAVKETAAAIGNIDYANEQLEHELDMKLREMERNGATEVQKVEKRLEYDTKMRNNAANALNKAKGDFMNAMAKEGKNEISIERLQDVLGDDISPKKIQEALAGTGILIVDEAKKVNKEVVKQLDGILKEYDKFEKAEQKLDKTKQDLLDAQSGKNGGPGDKKTKTEIEIKFDGVDSEFDKLEKETEDYLDWYANEYQKSEEEVRVHKIEEQAKALKELKHKEWQAVEDNIAAKKKEVKEKREAGEISEEEAQAKYKEIEEEGIKAKEKINERYRNLRTRLDVKNAAEAAVEMNEIYLSRAQELFNEIDKGWAESYENQIYRLRQFQDAVNNLGTRGRGGFFAQNDLTKNYVNELGALRLELEKTFGVFYNEESGMIENHISLARQMTQEHIDSIRKENEELQKVLDSSTVSLEEQQKAAIKMQVNLSVIDQHMRELETLKVSENSEEVFNTISQAYAEVVKRIQDFNSIPPLDLDNFFDDNQVTEYFRILRDEENNIYIARANQIQETITKLKEQAALMTDGSEERLETERLIAEAEKELSDTTTEHILNNMQNRDNEEQKLLENREKRVQYWKESVEGISATLSNLGNIFQNELQREVDAKEISVEAAEERYKSLKALNYAAVIMDTSSAIMSAWKSAMEMPQPYGYIWGGIQTAALLTQGTLQAQQIARQQFSASSSSTPGVTATPTQADYSPQYTANMTSNSELTELTNALNKRKLFVSVTDIEDTEKMVQARDSESTY